MNLFLQLKFLSLFLLVLSSCERDLQVTASNPANDSTPLIFKTKNVIVVVIDGPRYSETWGDSTKRNIPYMHGLSKEGVLLSDFRNNGPTYTNSGYTAITTGNYQEINNSGLQLPDNPSLFQHWLKKKNLRPEKCWAIQSKGKLKILANCEDEQWNGLYMPTTNCGSDGQGNGYRNDSLTFLVATNIMKEHHPVLLLLGFKEPDYSAHTGDWNGYIEGIRKTDKYIYDLWNFVQADSVYKNNTALFVTNDHGRHLDSTGGFAHHGDGCEGCRRVSLLAIGPDFYKNKLIASPYELIDIPATISSMLDFEMPAGKGRVINEMIR